jgi:dTDP-4-amino-4,6-dideoxygalactose transaminase
MRAPFVDVGAGYRELRQELDEAIARVMASGHCIPGRECAAFEEEFSYFAGKRYCVGVANGLDALTLILRAMDIGGRLRGAGSRSHVRGATWLAVSASGAVPIPVDVDDLTFNVDPGRIEQAITPRTAAILPVHLYGQPAIRRAILIP